MNAQARQTGGVAGRVPAVLDRRQVLGSVTGLLIERMGNTLPIEGGPMRKLLILSAAIIATPAAAAPTYLVCSFEKVNSDVTADEANGEVTTLVSTSGHLEKAAGNLLG